MNCKNMTREKALKTIELLNKRIDFNNKLNKFCRKFVKDNNIDLVKFNGFWDEPTLEMIGAFKNIFLYDSIENLDWMSDELRTEYIRSCSQIFAGLYSPSVNTYILKDLHDCEKYLETLSNAESQDEEENDLFRIERDTQSNRINLYFDGKPEQEVINCLKHNGFRWSPKFSCWTRQLTSEAEKSLERIKKELNK